MIEELIKHKRMKDDEITTRNMVLLVEESLDEYDEECEKKSQPRGPRWYVPAKKRRVRGPLDRFITTPPADILQGREDRKSVLGACDKDLRENVSGAITKWFLDC